MMWDGLFIPFVIASECVNSWERERVNPENISSRVDVLLTLITVTSTSLWWGDVCEHNAPWALNEKDTL